MGSDKHMLPGKSRMKNKNEEYKKKLLSFFQHHRAFTSGLAGILGQINKEKASNLFLP